MVRLAGLAALYPKPPPELVDLKATFHSLCELLLLRTDGVDDEGCIQYGQPIPEVPFGFFWVAPDTDPGTITVVDPSFRLAYGFGPEDPEFDPRPHFCAGAQWMFKGAAPGLWLVCCRRSHARFECCDRSEFREEPKRRENRMLCMFHQDAMQTRVGAWKQSLKSLSPNWSEYKTNEPNVRVVPVAVVAPEDRVHLADGPTSEPAVLPEGEFMNVDVASARPPMFFRDKMNFRPTMKPVPEQLQLWCDTLSSRDTRRVVGIHVQIGGAPVGEQLWWEPDAVSTTS